MSESVYKILEKFSDIVLQSEYKDLALILSEYLKYLYDEDVLTDDISETELDDFINFYLIDKYPKYTHLKKNSLFFLKDLFKYLRENKHLSKESIKEWKNFFSGTEV